MPLGHRLAPRANSCYASSVIHRIAARWLVVLAWLSLGSARAESDAAAATPQPPALRPPTPPLAPPPRGGEGQLRYDLRIDVPLAVAGGAAWILTEIFENRIGHGSCRWCERAPDGTLDLDSLDLMARDNLRLTHPDDAVLAGDIMSYAVAPVVAFGLTSIALLHDRRPAKQWLVDMVLIIEATVAAADVNQMLKFTTARDRPFTHDLTVEELARRHKPNDHMSFASGHTTLAFSLAVASGTIASLRGYRLAPLVWASGLAVALTTGYLRIASDQHFLTDVIAGAAIGSAFGFAIPYFFHRLRGPARRLMPSAQPLPGGATLGMSGAW